MSDFDIVVVGELNADMILHDPQGFPEMGKEKLAKGMLLTMGSASAIFATNIAHLGMKVGFVGKLGNDYLGKIVTDTLAERGVDCTGIQVKDDEQTGVTVALSYPEDYAMMTYMGAMETFTLADVDFNYVKRGKHLHLSSYYLQPGMRPYCAELFKKAKDLGMTTSFDPGWDPAEKWEADILEVLPFVDVFLPNESEAMFIAHKDSIEDALEFLSQYAATTVITCGSEGCIARVKGKTYRTKVYTVTPIDTTGAGDSFNCGFLASWLHGEAVTESLVAGSACGAIATTRAGGATASPNKKEMLAFISEKGKDIFVS
ncbi:MAG: sugar kinase [Candidatus Marinimicrobia bacterium]|nr:sugar kinase [Candidatus Neomarinimicrobiota bacterium]